TPGGTKVVGTSKNSWMLASGGDSHRWTSACNVGNAAPVRPRSHAAVDCEPHRHGAGKDTGATPRTKCVGRTARSAKRRARQRTNRRGPQTRKHEQTLELQSLIR